MKKFAYPEIIFFDIDGTLVDEFNEISASTVETLHLLDQKGILLAICTGRFPYECGEFFSTHPNLPFSLLICAGGALAFKGDAIIVNKPIPAQDLIPFLNVARIHGVPYWTAGIDGFFYSVRSLDGIRDLLHPSELLRTDFYDPDYHLAHDVYGGEMVPSPEQLSLFKPVSDRIIIAQGMHIGGLPSRAFDFYRRDVNKGTGILDCLKILGIPPGKAMAIGDSSNDIPAFRVVGSSVLMGNSSPNIHHHATFVTDTIHNDGIRKAMLYFGVI